MTWPDVIVGSDADDEAGSAARAAAEPSADPAGLLCRARPVVMRCVEGVVSERRPMTVGRHRDTVAGAHSAPPLATSAMASTIFV